MIETRQGVIAHHIHRAIRHGVSTERRIAADVAEHYLRTVPLHAQHVGFHATRDIVADERANTQILHRFVDGTVRMPVEVEESIIFALPQPFRTDLLRELCERVGLLAAPIPGHDGARDDVSTAELMRETGEFLTAMAPVLKDGAIDAHDLPHARRALRELRDVQARCVSIEARLAALLAGGEPSNVKSLRGAA